MCVVYTNRLLNALVHVTMSANNLYKATHEFTQ